MQTGYQQNLGGGGYNYCYRGDLWKYYLIVGIIQVISGIISLATSGDPGNLLNGIINIMMSFAFKDLTISDISHGLFAKWGPFALCKYVTCGCYNCQELDLHYQDIESYHIEDWSCWRHWFGISRCCFDTPCCASVTYSNTKCCCCNTDPYKVFKFRLKHGYHTWFPFKECDPCCCCCCRAKYIGIVTDDVNGLNNLLRSKNIPMNSDGGPVTLVVGNNQQNQQYVTPNYNQPVPVEGPGNNNTNVTV